MVAHDALKSVLTIPRNTHEQGNVLGRAVIASPLCTENLNPDMVMKAAEDCVRVNGSEPLNRARDRSIFDRCVLISLL